jgi:hypothetical protein
MLADQFLGCGELRWFGLSGKCQLESPAGLRGGVSPCLTL